MEGKMAAGAFGRARNSGWGGPYLLGCHFTKCSGFFSSSLARCVQLVPHPCSIAVSAKGTPSIRQVSVIWVLVFVAWHQDSVKDVTHSPALTCYLECIMWPWENVLRYHVVSLTSQFPSFRVLCGHSGQHDVCVTSRERCHVLYGVYSTNSNSVSCRVIFSVLRDIMMFHV